VKTSITLPRSRFVTIKVCRRTPCSTTWLKQKQFDACSTAFPFETPVFRLRRVCTLPFAFRPGSHDARHSRFLCFGHASWASRLVSPATASCRAPYLDVRRRHHQKIARSQERQKRLAGSNCYKERSQGCTAPRITVGPAEQRARCGAYMSYF